MGRVRLETAATVTLDASGNGTVEFVVPYAQRWRITRMTVGTVIQIPPIPRAVVYRNSVGAQNVVDGTYTGTMDTSDLSSAVVFEGGEKVVVQWTAGTPTDKATATIAGELEMVG